MGTAINCNTRRQKPALRQTNKNLLCPLEIFGERRVFRHLPDVFPVLVQREAHHREDPIQLKTRNQSVLKTLSGEQVFLSD